MEKLTKKALSLQDKGVTLIERLAHIGTMLRSGNLEPIINDMSLEDFEAIIPDLTLDMWYDYEDEKVKLLTDNNKYGLIAQCSFCEPQNCSFDTNGNLISYFQTHNYIDYFLYADTLEELIDKLIDKDSKMFKESVDLERNKLPHTISII